jgi:hypothetical protein
VLATVCVVVMMSVFCSYPVDVEKRVVGAHVVEILVMLPPP